MISEPFFLDTDAGRLFAVHHRPDADVAARGQVLLAPPFNEEMNRCRSMVTLQAQALAALGWGTLVLDLNGTGDSSGDYVDGRWGDWLANLSAGRDWLQQQPGGCRAVWGIRLGTIFAAELHARWADPAMALLLWQPVTDGKTHLTQFMRVRIAAAMSRADLPKETTSNMRQTWADGGTVEIAGYELHADLAKAIDAAALTQHTLPAGGHLFWLEQAVPDQEGLSPASARALATWPGAQSKVTQQTFQGPAFWQVHERMLAPEAIAHTTTWLKAWGRNA